MISPGFPCCMFSMPLTPESVRTAKTYDLFLLLWSGSGAPVLNVRVVVKWCASAKMYKYCRCLGFEVQCQDIRPVAHGNRNKSFMFAQGQHLETKSNGNKSHILALGHHFEIKAASTNRTSHVFSFLGHCGAPVGDQSNGNKSHILKHHENRCYIRALGHHLEAKATATGRISENCNKS